MDHLEEAKKRMQLKKRMQFMEGNERNQPMTKLTQEAIAHALIALVERLDGMTTEDACGGAYLRLRVYTKDKIEC